LIVDLHAHYPMHIVPGARADVPKLLHTAERLRLRDRVRAQLVGFASRFANYRTFCSGPRVRLKYMREGEVEAVLSVLYSFWDEIDVAHGPRPRPGYEATLERALHDVEARVAQRPHDATIARSPAALAAAREAGLLAVVHCIEGGFHLGTEPAEVERSVARLAGLGVAYITLAHLIWRDVATDAPALPFLTDAQYRHLFPQPAE
jgi:microsomal dipeptidase-like Zn-dependent dipeptidase